MPDNDNNHLLDPKVKQQALLELSKRLRELHQAIEAADDALALLRPNAVSSCEADRSRLTNIKKTVSNIERCPIFPPTSGGQNGCAQAGGEAAIEDS